MDETTRSQAGHGSEGPNESRADTRRLRRLLRQTAKVAREASLTGSLKAVRASPRGNTTTFWNISSVAVRFLKICSRNWKTGPALTKWAWPPRN